MKTTGAGLLRKSVRGRKSVAATGAGVITRTLIRDVDCAAAATVGVTTISTLSETLESDATGLFRHHIRPSADPREIRMALQQIARWLKEGDAYSVGYKGESIGKLLDDIKQQLDDHEQRVYDLENP